MGLCASSAEGMAVAPAAATAMVVLPTGELREYPAPVATASRVLEDCVRGDGGWILCDADAMGFEGAVAAVAGGEALRAGQIYFVLPAEARRRGLRREEVAALAVKASAALARAGSAGGRRRRGAVAPLVFPPPEEKPEYAPVLKPASAPARKGSMRRQHSRFAPDLSAIPECDSSE